MPAFSLLNDLVSQPATGVTASQRKGSRKGQTQNSSRNFGNVLEASRLQPQERPVQARFEARPPEASRIQPPQRPADGKKAEQVDRTNDAPRVDRDPSADDAAKKSDAAARPQAANPDDASVAKDNANAPQAQENETAGKRKAGVAQEGEKAAENPLAAQLLALAGQTLQDVAPTTNAELAVAAQQVTQAIQPGAATLVTVANDAVDGITATNTNAAAVKQAVANITAGPTLADAKDALAVQGLAAAQGASDAASQDTNANTNGGKADQNALADTAKLKLPATDASKAADTNETAAKPEDKLKAEARGEAKATTHHTLSAAARDIAAFAEGTKAAAAPEQAGGAPGVHTVAAIEQPGQAKAADPAQAASRADAPVPLHAAAIEIGIRVARGAREFAIRLDPEDLGRVDIKLEISKEGQVQAKLMVERVETLNLLQRDAKTLERAFDQAGLKTTPDGLQFSLRDPGQQGQQNGHQNHSSHRPSISAKDADIPQIDDIALRPALYRSAANGGLDIRI